MTASVIYLHGFASSPASSKVQVFARHFAARGIALRAPDLNVPDFAHLTLTAMMARAAEEIAACPPGPVYLAGSSMGGAVALHTVDRVPQAAARVEKLLLLAPALDFAANPLGNLDAEGMALWRARGWQPFIHYQYGQTVDVHYGLIEDLAGYDAFATRVTKPILIYHGLRDEVVDPRGSIRFTRQRPNVALRLVDSDHQLLDKAEAIAAAGIAYFGV